MPIETKTYSEDLILWTFKTFNKTEKKNNISFKMFFFKSTN